jgi:hypothetical protein
MMFCKKTIEDDGKQWKTIVSQIGHIKSLVIKSLVIKLLNHWYPQFPGSLVRV